MPGPLHGIRVLEFGQIIAGPLAALFLSDLGADVVKVEPLEGEARRNTGAVVPNEGKYFQSLNRGKRSLTLDLARAEAREVLRRLVPRFDVVLINYRLGVAERLGIDYASLSRLRPDLIYANITGFGDDGPEAGRAGSDVVAQAYSGLMAAEAMTDDAGAPRPVSATPVIDRASALATAMGVCAALYHRALTGEGQELHVSLLHTGLELLSRHVMREPVHDAASRDPLVERLRALRTSGARYDEMAEARRSSSLRLASHRLYYGGYHTAQGALVLGALTRPTRDAVRRILDMHDDTDAPGFDAADHANQQRVEDWRSEIQEKLLARPATEWVDTFVAAGVPASVVNFPEELSDDPQVQAMGMMVDLVHPITGPQRVVGPLVRMSRTPSEPTLPAPPLGWHSQEVLLEAGFTTEEVDALLTSRVVGSPE